MGKEVRVRMAPSPTGFIHVGSIYTSLFNFVFAKKHRGKFVLRIEDTDRKRFVEGGEESIYDGLEWVGLIPDEGPKNPGKYSPYRQSKRLDIYRKYAEELVKIGAAYYCFCGVERLERMRQKQQEKGLPPKYDRRCLNLPVAKIKEKIKLGEPTVIRLKIPDDCKVIFTDLIRGKVEFDAKDIDDQVLLKSDGFPTYHLAVVVDDHLMEITHVIRAEEWISSTPKHIVLYKAFGWEIPIHAHLPVLRNPDKSKISKRRGHSDLRWYKREGYLPEALLNFLALLGWSHPKNEEIFSLSEMIKIFSFDRFSKTGPVFNIEKLDWMNGVYIRRLDAGELVERIINYLEMFKKDSIVLKSERRLVEKVVALEQERLKKLSEFEDLSGFFFDEDVLFDIKTLVSKNKDLERSIYVIEQTKKLFNDLKEWTAAAIEKSLETLLKELPDWSKREFYMMVRIAATGKTATPPLFETLGVLGKEKTLARLDKAVTYLKA